MLNWLAKNIIKNESKKEKHYMAQFTGCSYQI